MMHVFDDGKVQLTGNDEQEIGRRTNFSNFFQKGGPLVK